MIIAFINQKGGVGKTTSTINVGDGLASLGFKTLLIDFDPQANLTSGLGVGVKKNTVYDALYNPQKTSQTITETSRSLLFVLPASNALSGAVVEMVPLTQREYFLKKAIETVQKDFDFILIDCPPSLGLLTINALCAAQSIIIPLQCEYYAMEGIAQLIKNFTLIQQSLNPKLFIFGIILTMFDSRTKLSQDVAKEIVQAFGGHVFNTVIPRNIRLAEAPSFGKTIQEQDPNSVGAQSYLSLTSEVIQRWKKNQ